MAKVMTKKSSFAARLRDALRDGLALAGLNSPKIELESIPGTKLNRVTILSKGFGKMRPSERQDLVWRIVGSAFPREEQLQISAIYTFAPDELLG
jgi:hypothetical protein